jgi:hypothetical protein
MTARNEFVRQRTSSWPVQLALGDSAGCGRWTR